MFQTFYRLLIELTNRKWTSHLLATFAQSKISRFFIPSFSKVYKINQVELEKPLCEYKTLHDFFTRKLINEARKICKDASAVISPVDAVIEEIGTISLDHSIIVKGKNYSISEMIGGTDKVQKYLNGIYIIFYLSPSNYHRIHSPVTGKVVDQWTLGTKSYPVNKYGLKYGKSPLSKNYRMITEVYVEGASMAIVKVGAMFVNSIEVLDIGDELKKGEEIAFFSFGSTVVLLFETETFEPAISKNVPLPIKVGECIGYMKEIKEIK